MASATSDKVNQTKKRISAAATRRGRRVSVRRTGADRESAAAGGNERYVFADAKHFQRSAVAAFGRKAKRKIMDRDFAG